jgi:hypothetical protein
MGGCIIAQNRVIVRENEKYVCIFQNNMQDISVFKRSGDYICAASGTINAALLRSG